MLHSSELKQVKDLPQPWLEETRAAMLAATDSAENKTRPLTYEEEQSRKVSSYGRVAVYRYIAVKEASEMLAA